MSADPPSAEDAPRPADSPSEDVALAAEDIEEYLRRHERKQLLRFVAVGSVDDGKSTLIGRLLHDTHGIYEDQLAAVERASKTRGSAGGKLDLALLTDGLKAEREQGITIDVAYRYFSTDHRKFIIADTPGHIQYTRNMATGASTADVALILIDARHGVLQQSRRHAYIASLLGIPHLAVCVNKMDLVQFDEATYEAIKRDFAKLSARLRFREIRFFPVSAVDGDNIVHRSERSPWHDSGTLLKYLESVPISADQNMDVFRFPVQYVLRPDLDFRGFCGQVSSGVVRAGDDVQIMPSGKRSRVASIDTFDGQLKEAFAPMSVTLRLEDEIDISRGDMIVHPSSPPVASQRFEAHVVWMSETVLDVHGSYVIKHTTRTIRANVEKVLARFDLDTLEEIPTDRLELNDIGRLVITTNQPIFFDAYADNRDTGAFVLIDALSNDTVGACMIIGEAQAEASDAAGSTTASRAVASGIGAGERCSRLGHTALVIAHEGYGADTTEAQKALSQSLERTLFDAGLLTTIVDVERLSEGTRSPALVADVATQCFTAGLVTILSTGLPRAAQRTELESRLGESLLWLEQDVEKDVQGLAARVLKKLGRG